MTATNENLTPKKILLVDDFRDFVLATRIFLETEGYQVVEAYDGVQALEALERETPDLVIMDVMMPRMDGWAALAKMQAEERFQDIPVLMLTALKEPAYVKQGIDLGCMFYYVKPITDYPDFALVISRILSSLDAPAEDVADW